MISAWWLTLIIPSTFMIGYIVGGIFSSVSKLDDCIECSANKDKEA